VNISRLESSIRDILFLVVIIFFIGCKPASVHMVIARMHIAIDAALTWVVGSLS
jgi:hypothetical protein